MLHTTVREDFLNKYSPQKLAIGANTDNSIALSTGAQGNGKYF